MDPKEGVPFSILQPRLATAGALPTSKAASSASGKNPSTSVTGTDCVQGLVNSICARIEAARSPLAHLGEYIQVLCHITGHATLSRTWTIRLKGEPQLAILYYPLHTRLRILGGKYSEPLEQLAVCKRTMETNSSFLAQRKYTRTKEV